MMNCNLYIVGFLVMFHGIMNAQSASEILKYGSARPFATARSTGVGGAMGSLGGDFTATEINPAGIGLFRKSDYYLSFSVNFDEQNSSLTGNGNPEYSKSKEAFQLSGIGYVKTYQPFWNSKWRNAAYAINFTRSADFNKSYYFKGRSAGSITDRFLELALDPNATGLIGLEPDALDDFEAGLAYETGAIFDPGTDSLHTIYHTDLLSYPGYKMPKEQILNTSGSLYNLSFGLGANYDEVVAIGASLNIPIGSFTSESKYSEYELVKDEFYPFRNLRFEERLNTTIAGINARFGVILKSIPNLRLGLAIQTPTYLYMSDEFNTSLQFTYHNGRRDTSHVAYSPDGEFTYRLILPMRAVLSAAFITQKGFLSADIDIFNLANSKYNLTADSDASADYDYQELVNDDIEKQYRAAIQFRVGGELVFSQYLRARAGIELLRQAFSNSDEFDSGFSLGAGFRGNRFYIDLAYKYSSANAAYTPYSTGNSDFDGNGSIDAPTPLVNQKNNQQFIQLTLGLKI